MGVLAWLKYILWLLGAGLALTKDWLFHFTSSVPGPGGRRQLTPAGKIALPIAFACVASGLAFTIYEDYRKAEEVRAAEEAKVRAEKQRGEDRQRADRDVKELRDRLAAIGYDLQRALDAIAEILADRKVMESVADQKPIVDRLRGVVDTPAFRQVIDSRPDLMPAIDESMQRLDLRDPSPASIRPSAPDRLAPVLSGPPESPALPPPAGDSAATESRDPDGREGFTPAVALSAGPVASQREWWRDVPGRVLCPDTQVLVVGVPPVGVLCVEGETVNLCKTGDDRCEWYATGEIQDDGNTLEFCAWRRGDARCRSGDPRYSRWRRVADRGGP